MIKRLFCWFWRKRLQDDETVKDVLGWRSFRRESRGGTITRVTFLFRVGKWII